jgi:hypothetical protein
MNNELSDGELSDALDGHRIQIEPTDDHVEAVRAVLLARTSVCSDNLDPAGRFGSPQTIDREKSSNWFSAKDGRLCCFDGWTSAHHATLR